jgi:hypothetical protein
MPVKVRGQVKKSGKGELIDEYKGYKYFAVKDKAGRFLFGFHVSCYDEAAVDVYFASAEVSVDKKGSRITVRSRI